MAEELFGAILDELRESLLKTSDDAEINWEANACDIIEALVEKEKADQRKKGRILPMIIQRTP